MSYGPLAPGAVYRYSLPHGSLGSVPFFQYGPFQLFTPDGAVGIGDTAVTEEARGAGVGAALTDAAIAWAREHDYRAVHLHFATPNLLSVPFWTGLGFTPVMWHMRRRLDERIAWARPED